MDTSRDDVGIAIRSAFLKKGTKQRFSLLVLVITSFLLIFLETIQTKPLNSVRSIVKDLIYRTALVSNYPLKSFSNLYNFVGDHFNLYKNYEEVVKENYELQLQKLNAQESFQACAGRVCCVTCWEALLLLF